MSITAQTLHTEPQAETAVQALDTEQVVTAVARELSCSRANAAAGLWYATEMVRRARSNGYSTIHPSSRDMSDPGYRIFDRLFQHGAGAPDAGSAADMVERFLLKPEQGETGIRHDQVETGLGAVDCNITVLVTTVG